MKKIGVIGLGNPLRRDDGIGILLLEKLIQKKNNFTKNIEFIDGGTGGISLIYLFAKFDIVFLIDAVDFNAEPGDFKFFKIDEKVTSDKKVNFTTHEDNILNVLELAWKIGEKPEVYIFAIQPKKTDFKNKLTKEIENKTDLLLSKLEEKIKTFL
jgi:hydrogenase maturation protease